MGVRAVEENASQERTADVARRAADEDVRNVADVLLHIHSQVLERGAKNRDTHPLGKQDISVRKPHDTLQQKKYLPLETVIYLTFVMFGALPELSRS